LLSQVSIPIARITVLFLVIFSVGTILTLCLYRLRWRTFIHSSLAIKILFWIPIFGVVLAFLYAGDFLRLLIIAALIILALTEAFAFRQTIARVYGVFVAFAFAQFLVLGVALPAIQTNAVITIAFGSALSDVTAFFFGKFFGRHPLPGFINPGKSYEGVAGQIIGALIGVLLVRSFVLAAPLWIFAPIGLGAALGDLTNSYVKRRLGIKDWSAAIPGHGGYLDRLSSLAGSAMLTFFTLALFGPGLY
jgi:CDP-diglyceride synthetase